MLQSRNWLIFMLLGLLAPFVHGDELIKAATPAAQKSKTKEPPALTHYMGREIAQTMHYLGAPWLIRESRDREEEPARLMKALGLKNGQTVCDLGCGNGFYTTRLAEAVGAEGKVLAVDIQPEMLEMLKKAAQKAKLTNIEPILGTTSDPKLPENKLDLVLLVDVYHEIDHPVEVLAGIRKSLSEHGRMCLVEFREEDASVPIKPLHKMSKKQVMKEIGANGFKLVEEYDDMPWQHVMFFERDQSWKGPAPRE